MMWKKIGWFTLIYIVITLLMSFEEIQCAFEGQEFCWINIIGKYVIFMLAVGVYQKWIRPMIFK